jgi:lipopolysaccharide heptosyltransferase III
MNASDLLPSLPAGARIVLIRLRSIGDIVLLTPALRLLKDWRPDLRISLAVESRFRELVEGNPSIEELIDPGGGSGWAKISSRFQAVRQIRRREFTLAVNLHGGPTGTLLTRTSGARWKVGFDYYRSRGVYDFLVPDTRGILGRDKVHTAEHQVAVFFHLGMPRREIPRAELYVRPEHQAWWKEKRTSLAIPESRGYAIVHPTALYATKQWSAENFAKLGEYLEREAGLVPIYSCGPGESSVLDAVERAAAAPVRRLEGASLGRFAAAIADTRLFVGNDSGPAHMAAALARPVVVIFGSSSSEIWGPWPRDESPLRSRIVQNFYECNPCPGDRCYQFERPECILSVTYEQVRSAVQELLGKTAER